MPDYWCRIVSALSQNAEVIAIAIVYLLSWIFAAMAIYQYITS